MLGPSQSDLCAPAHQGSAAHMMAARPAFVFGDEEAAYETVRSAQWLVFRQDADP
jgi:hypothetical protein